MMKWIKASDRLPGMRDELTVDKHGCFLCRRLTSKGYEFSVESSANVSADQEWLEHTLAEDVEPTPDLALLTAAEEYELATMYANKLKELEKQEKWPRVTYLRSLLSQNDAFFRKIITEEQKLAGTTNA